MRAGRGRGGGVRGPFWWEVRGGFGRSGGMISFMWSGVGVLIQRYCVPGDRVLKEEETLVDFTSGTSLFVNGNCRGCCH